LTAGFYYREKGVFASDGETEVLMFYMNSGDDAEWIEPPTVELVEKRIVSLYKGSQEESYSISTKSGIYVTSEEYDIDMGSDSISGIGNGTVKGAISSIRAFIANLEQSIASQAYAKGEYLVKGHSLRKVISTIASGGAITDSNTRETDVGKELTQINNSLTEINSNLSDSVVPEDITVTFGSNAFTNKIFFCRRIGRMIFYNIRFTTGNVAYPTSAAFALLSHPGSDLLVDPSQTSMRQNGFIMYDTSINTAGTGIASDGRLGISSYATLPANTNVYAFGFIMLK
jgi:hypothetical protein